MDMRIQIIVAVFIIIFLLVIINMIRRRSLQLSYSLVWLIVGVVVLILDLFPPLIGMLTNLMGIESPMNMLFFMGFCFTLIIIFTLSVALSRMSKRVKMLAQRIALYEKKKEEEDKKK